MRGVFVPRGAAWAGSRRASCETRGGLAAGVAGGSALDADVAATWMGLAILGGRPWPPLPDAALAVDERTADDADKLTTDARNVGAALTVDERTADDADKLTTDARDVGAALTMDERAADDAGELTTGAGDVGAAWTMDERAADDADELTTGARDVGAALTMDAGVGAALTSAAGVWRQNTSSPTEKLPVSAFLASK